MATKFFLLGIPCPLGKLKVLALLLFYPISDRVSKCL